MLFERVGLHAREQFLDRVTNVGAITTSDPHTTITCLSSGTGVWPSDDTYKGRT